MMYNEFKVGEKVYNLRLRTRDIVVLEKQIGCNPLAIFGNGEIIPPITTMVTILHYALQAYNHSINMNDTYDIFDNWLAEGHTVTDFIPVLLDIYRVSGIISTTGDNAEKN